MTTLSDLTALAAKLRHRDPSFLALTFSAALWRAISPAAAIGFPRGHPFAGVAIYVTNWQPEPYLIWRDEAELREYLALTVPPMLLPERLAEKPLTDTPA